MDLTRTTESFNGSRVLRRNPTTDGAEIPLGGRKASWYRTGLSPLLIVLVIVGVLYWFLRRRVPAGQAAESVGLRIVARTNLTPKHNLTLVQLGRRFVMLGVSPDRITSLCQISDPEEVAELALRTGASNGRGAHQFDELLKSEVAEYREDSKGRSSVRRIDAQRPMKSPKPLADLLRNLRGLQAK